MTTARLRDSETAELADHPRPTAQANDLALVLGGGGARAAYQVGVLSRLSREFPELDLQIITGVSAGAINAVYLASRVASLRQKMADLVRIWRELRTDDVFRVDSPSLGQILLRWGSRLVSGGSGAAPRTHGLVDTSPLLHFLHEAYALNGNEVPGIRENLDRGTLKALGITSLNYSTGQTVTWVQGRQIQTWERPNRRSFRTTITPTHVMASASLPLIFPAIRIGNAWFGDGGVRLAAPLSPALHLGARRILAISTRYNRSFEEADQPAIRGYPPPAQILGLLMNSVFLDVVDQDAARLERMNLLLERLPAEERRGFRLVDFVIIRPSQDLGKLARQYEAQLPGAFRFLTRGLGTRETSTPDFLSLLLFQPDYLRRLLDLGEEDAEARLPEIRSLLEAPAPSQVSSNPA